MKLNNLNFSKNSCAVSTENDIKFDEQSNGDVRMQDEGEKFNKNCENNDDLRRKFTKMLRFSDSNL